MYGIDILRGIYIILIILNLLIFLIKIKKINFIFIYFLSSIIYYMFAINGRLYTLHINGEITSYDINIKTYIVLIINMILILASMLIPEKDIVIRKKEKKKTNTTLEKLTMNTYFLFCAFLSIYSIVSMGILSNSGNFNKSMLLENTNTIVEYFKSFIMFAIVYIFVEKGIKYNILIKIVLISCLLITFLLGHRSYIIIAMIAIMVNYYNEKIAINDKNLFNNIIKHYKIIIGIVGIIFITFMIKGVTAAIFDKNFELVKARLTNLEYYINTFKISEPNTITMNLDTILRNNYTLEKSSYIFLITLFIPFISRFIQFESFTYAYQKDLFGVSNRASTFLGEAYANGGFLCVFLIIIILLLILKLIYIKLDKSNNNILKTFILISGIDMSFYIHRNSMDYALSRVRSYIYIIIFIYVIKVIIANLKILGRKNIK